MRVSRQKLATLSSSSVVNPTFVVDLPGTYVVRLVVNDGTVNSVPDTVSISTQNRPPVANAGPDQTVPLSSTVQLDGSASSDPDGNTLTYTWSILSKPPGSNATLSNANIVNPTFVADLAGTYVAQLIVNDGNVNSAPDTVTISTQNSIPIANAGPDQTVPAGSTVQLDGSLSNDPDGTPLFYFWSITTKPQGSNAVLSDPSIVNPTFVADRSGIYVAQLIVGDGFLVSAPDTVMITSQNQAPVVNAGPDQIITLPAVASLSGMVTDDGFPIPPGSTTTTWSQVSVQGTVTFGNANALSTTASFSQAGVYVLRLTADDGADSASDDVQVTVNPAAPVNRDPIANDDIASTVMNTAVDINVLANDSDPDGDPLTVTGATQPTNGATTVNSNNTVRYTPNNNFTGPDSFTYTISDGRGGTAGATVQVAVTSTTGCLPPTITSFVPVSGPVGTEVTITGDKLDCGPNRTLALNSTQMVITSLSPTEIKTFIPIGAQSGNFSIITDGGTGSAPAPFTVMSSSDFALTVSPSSGKVIQGSSSSYSVEVQSVGGQPFTGLANLSLTGLPAGVTASFSPATVTGGQRGMLTVTAQSNATLGTAPLTLSATATIDGQNVVKTTSFDLTVLEGNRTALLGQFMLVDGTPMPRITLTVMSQVNGAIIAQTETDDGGNFLILDPPVGTHVMSVDMTQFDTTKPYPIYGMDVTVVAGQATVLGPFKEKVPPPPSAFIPINSATQDQVITNPELPGVSITLPAGATVTGWDGVLKTKITIVKYLPDALPVPAPPFPTRSLFHFNFGTPMGGLPSVPLPVTLPNDQGAEPGEKVEIWYYDAAPFVGVPGTWRKAGMGTVSADGTKVVSDPGVGIERFCGKCGLTCIKRVIAGLLSRVIGAFTDGDPVDLYLGQQIEQKTDLVLPGRIPAVIHRTYNPANPFTISGFQLGLGPGWALSVDVVLLETSPSLRTLILPGNARYDFAQQGQGTFVNNTSPEFVGAALTLEAGNVHRLRFKDGSSWRFVAHPNSQLAGIDLLSQQTDRNGNVLTIQRDSSGNIAQLIEPSGRSLTFAYSGGLISQIRDPLGRTVSYTYSSGRLQTVTDPAGGVTAYTYNSANGIVSIKDPRNITYLTNEYDPEGRVSRQTMADGGAFKFEYLRPTGATTGAVTGAKVTDPRGNLRTYRFASSGLGAEIVNALGQATKFERDTRGLVTSTTDPIGRVTKFEYDSAGNITKITDPANNVRLFEYEPVFSKITKITDPLNNVTTFAYDGQGNLISITDPLGKTTQIAYNSFGQPISTTDPLGNITNFTYDSAGNLTALSDPLGNATNRTYDLVSRLISQTDPRGRATGFTYDPLNRITQIVDAAMGITGFTYDGNGNLLTVTDARNNSTTYSYDSMDRLATRTDPVKATEFFQYDTAGNLTRHTDRKAQVNTFTYDPLNRRTGGNYADGTTTTFAYDSVGRLVQAADSVGGTIINSYDNLDRLSAQTTNLGMIQYHFDALGRRTQMTVAGQSPVTYTYDTASRLRAITQAPLKPVTIDYDDLGRRTLLTLPNGVSTEYLYDTASRLTELMYRNASGVLGNLTYQYDIAGNRTGVDGSFARTLLPDLVAASNYDAGNRQLQFGNKAMTFDNNGNLTSIAEPTGSIALTWDARNRLATLNAPGTTALFTYDPFGRRASKQINGQLTQFLYDRLDIVRELTGGNPTNYLRSLNTDELLKPSSTEHVLADALGSSIMLTDQSGIARATYTFEAFGKTNTAGTSTNSFQYTGRENDGAGIYYYRARYYSPELHRFVTEDPVGFADGMNLYSYVRNNPINFLDALGHKAGNRDFWWRAFWHAFLQGVHQTAIGELEGLLQSYANAISLDLWNPNVDFSSLYAYGDCLKCSPSYWEGRAIGRAAGVLITEALKIGQFSNLIDKTFLSRFGDNAARYMSSLKSPLRSSKVRQMLADATRSSDALYSLSLFEGFLTVRKLYLEYQETNR